MTDRHNGFTVTLEHDIRSDDAEATIAAIRQLKGVLAVDPMVSTHADHVAQMRARHELGEKLWRVLYPEKA